MSASLLLLHPARWSSAGAQPGVLQVARYALDAAALPSVTETLTVAEAMREAVQSRYGRATGGAAAPVFSGHGATGVPLKGHWHARYLPADEDGDGRLDHLTVVSASGYRAPERAALLAVDHIRVGRGRRVIRLGALELTGLEVLQRGEGPGVPLFGTFLQWESVTPFFLSRHPKRHSDGAEEQLRREAAQLGLPDIDLVERTDPPRAPGTSSWASFQRRRRRGPGPAMSVAFGFRIRFARLVSGPLALGYASHFGLGLFAGARAGSHA